ncbi:response regulator [Frigidibacter albus]|uniref:Response regulator n=1 Tax=Frigidibacter albus TaxID=1465486 RepID=A0A6L8VDT6_9RHOB|nr:sigma-54 dependent transcriptional regulator [Frigidibacter albus]MZQ87782.1 response regulator [Frigidibacter albus]NBE29688.1 response regulator [Frigidibacter albus]GGH43324.1 sigma-54-dependent Fis family transcriptional regulator [Frigidibacter albus]
MTSPQPTILLVDDEPHSLSAMRMALEDEFDCLTAADAATALAKMEEDWVQVVICDQRMPGRTGVEFLTELRDRWPDVVRIIITGYTDPAAMAQAINDAGIHQFINKPWHPDQLLMSARNGAKLFQLARENERMALEMRFLATTSQSKLEKRRAALREGMGFESLLRSPQSPMNALIDTARHFASFDVPVLLLGEAGTGRARLARAMHYGSLRSDKPFHALNLAGLPEDLAMVELFGAKRGILPGGVNKIGLVQKADRGTLFVEGVEHASPALQLALWRLVEEGSFSPLGGQEVLTTNLRLIAGAGADLPARVADGRFRLDLYYALAVTELPLPPLRARRGDIALLAQHFLSDLAAAHGKAAHGFSPAALEFLEGYDWPGNLRELYNEVTRMLIFAQSPVLGAELISRPILQAMPSENGADRVAQSVLVADGTLKDRVELIEMRILRETLTRHRWNKSRAAVELGLSRVGLRAKLDRYGIMDPSGHLHEEED